MAKRLVLAMVVLGILSAGCSGPPKEEIGGPGSGTETSASEGDQLGSGNGGGIDRETLTSTDVEDFGFQTIFFDFDKYSLRSDAREALDANAEVLRANPSLAIVIAGHCDERGTDEYNLALGERRAKASRDYLVRLGIDASRVSVISYGEEQPVSFGHDEASWRLNRRGEFELQ